MTAPIVSEFRVPVAAYQQVPGTDLTAIGTGGQGSTDNVVANILIAGVGYTGMAVSQVGTSNILTVQPGYLIKAGPAFSLRDPFNIDVSAAINAVPDSGKFVKVAIIADGAEMPSTETRTFVDSSRLPTDPTSPAPTVTQATPTRIIRSVVISSPFGTADVQPQLPSFSATLCLLAIVVVSNTAIVSVQQNTATQVTRLDQIVPVVTGLASQVSGFSSQIQGLLSSVAAINSYMTSKFASEDSQIQDLEARVTAIEQKNAAPPTSVLSWNDFFLDGLALQPNGGAVTYKTGGGLTFAGAGALNNLSLYNIVDPSLKYVNSRFVLFNWQALASVTDWGGLPNLTITGGNGQGEKVIFHSLPTWSVALTRSRFGKVRIQASPAIAAASATQAVLTGDPNLIWSQTGSGIGYDPSQFDWRAEGPEFIRQAGLSVSLTGRGYWGTGGTALPATGVTSAMEMLIIPTSDVYVSAVRIPVDKGTTGDVRFLITGDINGDPDPTNVIADVTVPYASIGLTDALSGNTVATAGGTPSIDVNFGYPILHEAGRRLHYVLLCNGDHAVYMATADYNLSTANSVARYNSNGTWFPTSTTNKGFAFAYNYVVPGNGVASQFIEFNPVILANGFDTIDLLADVIIPKGCFFDICVKISGNYQSLYSAPNVVNPNVLNLLATKPTSIQFALRANGPSPILDLNSVSVNVTKQTASFNAPSTPKTTTGAVTKIQESVILVGFNPAYHSYADSLLTGTGYTTTAPSPTVVDQLQADGTLLRTSSWTLGSGVTSFEIDRVGSTTDATKQFTVRQAYGAASP